MEEKDEKNIGFNRKRAEGNNKSSRPKDLKLKARKLNRVNTISYVQMLDNNIHGENMAHALCDNAIEGLKHRLSVLRGYGEIHAVNLREMIFVMVYVSFDMVLDAYLIDNMTALIVKGSETEGYMDRMTDLLKYMNRNRLGRDIRTKIKGHLRLQYEIKYTDSAILRDLPISIRAKKSWCGEARRKLAAHFRCGDCETSSSLHQLAAVGCYLKQSNLGQPGAEKTLKDETLESLKAMTAAVSCYLKQSITSSLENMYMMRLYGSESKHDEVIREIREVTVTNLLDVDINNNDFGFSAYMPTSKTLNLA
ncbi:hypothetical protein Tco_1040285 [Tanacetum coccineum]